MSLDLKAKILTAKDTEGLQFSETLSLYGQLAKLQGPEEQRSAWPQSLGFCMKNLGDSQFLPSV